MLLLPVGDTEIMAYRYRLVEFAQPYVESGLDMVVTQNKSKETWMFLKAFTKRDMVVDGINAYFHRICYLVYRAGSQCRTTRVWSHALAFSYCNFLRTQ